MSLGSDLTLHLWGNVPQGYENSISGKRTYGDTAQSFKLGELSQAENGLYHMQAEMAVAQMTEKIELVLSHKVIGEAVRKNYTVRDYLEALIEGNYDQATKDLSLELLNMGAWAQKYFDYNTDNLANSFLSKEDAKVRKVSNLVNVYAQTGDGAKITSVSMICGNSIGFKFMTDAVAGASSYVLQFADNAEFTDATEVPMVATVLGDEYKAITYVGIPDVATTVYARVVIDGEAGATLTYSVESFFARTKDTLDDGFYHLTLAMVAFGRSAAALA
jgi:hypothetical protein